MLLSYESLTTSGTKSLSWKFILPGGKLERLEHYLRWPLKLCIFIEWTELEDLKGLFEQRPENSVGSSALRVSLQQDIPVVFGGFQEAFHPLEYRSLLQGIPCHSYFLETALYCWISSLFPKKSKQYIDLFIAF